MTSAEISGGGSNVTHNSCVINLISNLQNYIGVLE
jgi:hypothetical protein